MRRSDCVWSILSNVGRETSVLVLDLGNYEAIPGFARLTPRGPNGHATFMTSTLNVFTLVICVPAEQLTKFSLVLFVFENWGTQFDFKNKTTNLSGKNPQKVPSQQLAGRSSTNMYATYQGLSPKNCFNCWLLCIFGVVGLNQPKPFLEILTSTYYSPNM